MEDSEENRSLKNDILEVIDSLLARPEMFAGESVLALEAQFFNLITVVAPYAFDMNSRDAGEKIVAYIGLTTENAQSLSSYTQDIRHAANILKNCYRENFECYTRSETLH